MTTVAPLLTDCRRRPRQDDGTRHGISLPGRRPHLRGGLTRGSLLDHPLRSRRARPARSGTARRRRRAARPRRSAGLVLALPAAQLASGAAAATPVRALGFDAAKVRALFVEEPGVNQALTFRIAEVIAHRLQSARSRLLDLYGPAGDGSLRR